MILGGVVFFLLHVFGEVLIQEALEFGAILVELHNYSEVVEGGFL
jgi:hypothetical protein